MVTNVRSLISIDDLSLDTINYIFKLTDCYKDADKDNLGKLRALSQLHGRVITNLFYEPSTRTSSSFFSAASKLGASVNSINTVSYSSVVKGESFEDTIMTLAQYSDAIVLRHNVEGSALKASQISPIPIINAGDGTGEHPSQSLLDCFTILSYNQFNTDSVIGFMGDLLNGRTVHSLVKLLTKLGFKNFRFISSNELQIKDSYLTKESSKHDSLDDTIDSLDVLYVTRLQKERLPDHMKKIHYPFSVTRQHLDRLPKSSIVMHPLPRVDELPASLDSDPRLVHLTQMRNGLYIRMACLQWILGNNSTISF